MLTVSSVQRDLVLVGGGHAHALALRMLAMRPIGGLRITLVSPSSHTPYSGMLPGLLAGHYRFAETHIDLARLCQWAGARFIEAEVNALDTRARQLGLPGRPVLGYDVLSLDIGSQPDLDSVPGAREHATPVKPVAEFWARWQALEATLLQGDCVSSRHIALVGGGAGSVELALAMAHRLRDRAPAFSLFCAAADILPGYHPRARATAKQALSRAGIAVHCASRVSAVRAGQLTVANGGSTSFDALFWCTGAAAAPWVGASGLRTVPGGFLAVHDTLQSVDDPVVFAAGDIATQLQHPRPKAGVYAVRQAPVLAANLRNLLLQRPLRAHRPQQRFLSLLSLGERRAVAERGPFVASGAWAWRWKDRIDRRFMAQFAALPEHMSDAPADTLPETLVAATQAPCGGCGAKVGGDRLAAALAELRQRYPQNCPTADGAEDAAVVTTPAGGIQLQSLDILRGLVSDPWLMGRIAANHALSDLYASGAQPTTALAALTLPFSGPSVQQRDLVQLLAGALHEFAAVGCQLVGGHSLQGPELALGFAVSGEPMGGAGQFLRKRALREGDRLLLTKPLGTGTLFAAHMQLQADGRDLHSAIDSMLQSSYTAARVALAQGASAATDVTGFGLWGHLQEMLRPEQGAVLELGALPVLPGALAQLAAGRRSTMHEANARNSGAGAATDPRYDLLFDPQTSGGLLLGVAEAAAAGLLAALHEAGYPDAAEIGEIVPLSAGTEPIRCR